MAEIHCLEGVGLNQPTKKDSGQKQIASNVRRAAQKSIIVNFTLKMFT